ncbi:MAG: hemolysin family protein [Peptococcaceae bacterium]|nr:hemolysin family protein [Peptococcaceae bacterium]
MDSSLIGMTVAIVILVMCSAYFSATETAFTSLNTIRMKTWAENGDKRAARALAVGEDYDKLLSSILIGNNIVNITATTISTLLFTKIFVTYGATISTVVITIVVLIFGEISPKSVAKEFPERFAMFSAPILRVIILVLTPLNFLFSMWKKLLSKIFKPSGDDGITEEELMGIVDQAESEGGLDAHEGDLIRASIEFNELDVSDILTPRVDLVAVDEESTMQEVGALFVENGYSRLPIYHETIDNIIGVVHQKDFYKARVRGEDRLAMIKSPVVYTTPNTKIFKLLRILQMNKVHMAVVVDEYGGTEGIVTLEDILEELVGEIWDEHDEVTEFLHKQPDGSYNIDCTTDLDDMYDLFEIKGECEASTVSGWVLEQIDRIPKQGDHFIAEGLEVTVTAVDNRRVMEINVKPVPQEKAESDDE